MDVYERIKQIGIVPVVKVVRASDIVPLLGALSEGGIPVAEITFRTECAEEAIKLATERFGEEVLIGAGTVTEAGQAERAIKAGAKFIVSPGLSDEVSEVCRKAGVPYVAGAVTPTEIMRTLALGNRIVKFFPATVYGGVSAIKALSAPFKGVEFLPTGGVNASNLKDFISVKNVVAVGGSWMVKDAYIEAGDFAEITKLSREARTIITETRGY